MSRPNTTPSLRPRANSVERHHMLYTKRHWLQTPQAQATRNLPAYSIDMQRKYHDLLHQVIAPPQRPTPKVVEAMYDIGYDQEHTGLNERARMDRIIDTMAGFAIATHSPEQSDQMLEVMSSLEAQMGNGADEDFNATEIDPLVDFLAHASLEAGDNQASAGEDALQLMTVHAAKGLEFHSVFISGLEEGLFPHENSINEHGGLEEERRLMYVAMTRAMRRLYLSHSQMRMLHGQTRYNIESRFIDEIPEELLKKINDAKSVSTTATQRTLSPSMTEQKDQAGFRVGQQVQHSKFGVGVIVQIEGQGADARLQVNFKDSGLKWLALEYAKLVRV